MLSCRTIVNRNTVASSKNIPLYQAFSIRSLHNQSPAITRTYQNQHLYSPRCPSNKSYLSKKSIKPYQRTFLPRTMSTTPAPETTNNQEDPAIQEILSYWFNLSPTEWFKDSAKLDPTITTRFSTLVEKARLTTDLDAKWTSTPSGSLALIILLDQFTRNIYRPGKHHTPGLSWSGDSKALSIANRSISLGFDRQIQTLNSSHRDLGYSHRTFFYLPFMHAEDLTSQNACVAFYEVMKNEVKIDRLMKEANGQKETEQEKTVREMLDFNLPFAVRHRDCVAAVGRFPSRNEHLDREHSEEERRWLVDHPMGF